MDQNLLQLFSDIKNAKSNKNWDAMIVLAQRGLLAYPQNSQLLELLHDAQAHYVEEKLKSNILNELEEKQDYLTLFAVYKKLLSVFPESNKLKKLLAHVKEKIQESERKANEQFFDSADLKIHELASQNKIDEAIQACNEILSLDPENKRFKKLSIKLDTLRSKILSDAMTPTFESLLLKMQTESRAKPELWIQI